MRSEAGFFGLSGLPSRESCGIFHIKLTTVETHMATVNTLKRKNLGALHTLLLRACPPDKEGNVSIPMLAECLDMSAQGVYRWLDNKRIPQSKVRPLLAVAGGRVTESELLPFVLN